MLQSLFGFVSAYVYISSWFALVLYQPSAISKRSCEKGHDLVSMALRLHRMQHNFMHKMHWALDGCKEEKMLVAHVWYLLQ